MRQIKIRQFLSSRNNVTSSRNLVGGDAKNAKLKSANFNFRPFSRNPPNIIPTNISSYTVVGSLYTCALCMWLSIIYNFLSPLSPSHPLTPTTPLFSPPPLTPLTPHPPLFTPHTSFLTPPSLTPHPITSHPSSLTPHHLQSASPLVRFKTMKLLELILQRSGDVVVMAKEEKKG